MNRLHKILVTLSLVFATTAHAGWQETFSDTFDGASLDTSKWINTTYWGERNRLWTGEKQCYVDNLATVGSGSLALTAINTPPVDCVPNPGTLAYQSGMVSTANSFRQIYGYFEMRAKMPKGQGLWPQFRLAIPGGPYPPTPPEIIIAETYGSASQLRNSYEDYDVSTFTYSPHPNVTNTAADLSAGFHTYGVDWQPGLVIYYYDGVEVGRYANANIFSQPLYITVNLAVGGNYAGAPNASTAFPAKMEIDYVKAFARVNDGNPDTLPPTVTPPVPPVPVDTVKPKIAILSPFNNSTVKRKTVLILAALATDNKKVTSVEFTANGATVCSSTNKPGEVCLWQVPATTSVSTYVIKATAKDAAGNSASHQVSIKAK